MKTATIRVCLVAVAAACVLYVGSASAITFTQPGFTQHVIADIAGGGPGFGGVVAGPDGNIYVTGGYFTNLFRVTPTGTVTTLTLNATNTILGVGIIGTTLYVGQNNGEIDTFNISLPTPTATLLATVPGSLNGNGNADFAVAPASFGAFGGQLIACNGGVYAVNPTTGAKTDIFVGSGDHYSSLDFGPNGTLYVADYDAGTVLTVSATGTTALFATLSGSSPDGLAVNPVTGNIFVADSSNSQIITITPAGVQSTFATGVDFSGGYYPSGLAFSSDGSTLYYIDGGGNGFELSAIQGFAPAETIPALGTAGWLTLAVLIAVAGAVGIKRALS
jgi:DNA-binding beta-propeller fold protein YncE